MAGTIKTAEEFQKRYPTKIGKTRALNRMTDSQIDKLIATCPNIQAKIFYASHKKKK